MTTASRAAHAERHLRTRPARLDLAGTRRPAHARTRRNERHELPRGLVALKCRRPSSDSELRLAPGTDIADYYRSRHVSAEVISVIKRFLDQSCRSAS
jgi:hypothetical protein